MSTKPPSDDSADMRVSDRSVEQMRTIVDGYAQFIRFGVPGDFITNSDLNIKVLRYVEENAASAFAFARKLLEAKDPQALFALQAEFIQAQLRAMAEQMQDIGTTTSRTMMGTANGVSKNGSGKFGPSS